MTAPKINWINVGKGLAIGAISLFGGVASSMGTLASQAHGDDIAPLTQRFEVHTATDSVRWMYMEQRIGRIEMLALKQIELQEKILEEIRK